MNCLVKKDGSEGTGRVLMEERGGKKKEEKIIEWIPCWLRGWERRDFNGEKKKKLFCYLVHKRRRKVFKKLIYFYNFGFKT